MVAVHGLRLRPAYPLLALRERAVYAVCGEMSMSQRDGGMTMTRVGTCSICGGDVRGVRGAWMSILPSPPDTCSNCGAVAGGDGIQMTPRPGPRRQYRTIRATGTNANGPRSPYDTDACSRTRR